ncbi:hypothetical protein N7448_011079 [Penicillium atrosanguineum]|nr:hypothetical protein N7448_011079 [Penicillium atrosanguineum]
MLPRGRPRLHKDDHSRWRTHAAHRRGQQATGSVSADPFPYFLFYDPRAIPKAPLADSPAATVLDSVHDALDAISLPRETDILSITSPVQETADPVVEDENIPGFDDELPDNNSLLSRLPPGPLATALVDQFEQPYRCQQHPSAPPSNQVSLSMICGWSCPDVLSQPAIAQYGVDWNILFPNEQRRKVFTGLPDDHPTSLVEPSPPTPPISLDLESDNIGNAENFEVWLDIDSAGGIASNLAVAREGIAWKAGRDAISNIRSSLHLDYPPVRWYDPSSRRHRSRHRPIHQIPHLPFGELAGFREVELYLIFPGLYDPTRDHWVITLEEYEVWTNRIFMPSLGKVYPNATVQHMPSSAQHIRLNGTAASVEGRAHRAPDTSYTQNFHYPLQAELLPALWDEIQACTTETGLTQFQDASIVLTAKNLKLSTRGRTWIQARDLFFRRWNRAVNAAYLQQDFYDIAKEVVPASPTTAQEDILSLPLTLSWRRCCLDGFCRWLAQRAAESGPLSNESSSPAASEPRIDPIEPSSNPEDNQSDDSSTEEDLAAAEPPAEERPAWRQEFYPQSLTRDQGSLTMAPFTRSPLRKGGFIIRSAL